MAPYRKLGLPLGALVLLLAACGAGAVGSNEGAASSEVRDADAGEGIYQTLSIEAFAEILANNAEDYTIINVHIPYAGEIEGTDANIAFNDLEALMAALPDRNSPVILYCRSGNMSEQASRALLERGYTQVWDVPGGMNAWQASGRELVDG